MKKKTVMRTFALGQTEMFLSLTPKNISDDSYVSVFKISKKY